MRLRLALCILLPLCILAMGTGILLYTHSVSLSLEQPASDIQALALLERYDDILTRIDALDALWAQKRDVLQLFIDHHAIDDVTLELIALRASAATRAQTDTLAAASRLCEHAQHLVHRDMPTLRNIL